MTVTDRSRPRRAHWRLTSRRSSIWSRSVGRRTLCVVHRVDCPEGDATTGMVTPSVIPRRSDLPRRGAATRARTASARRPFGRSSRVDCAPCSGSRTSRVAMSGTRSPRSKRVTTSHWRDDRSASPGTCEGSGSRWSPSTTPAACTSWAIRQRWRSSSRDPGVSSTSPRSRRSSRCRDGFPASPLVGVTTIRTRTKSPLA